MPAMIFPFSPAKFSARFPRMIGVMKVAVTRIAPIMETIGKIKSSLSARSTFQLALNKAQLLDNRANMVHLLPVVCIVKQKWQDERRRFCAGSRLTGNADNRGYISDVFFMQTQFAFGSRRSIAAVISPA